MKYFRLLNNLPKNLGEEGEVFLKAFLVKQFKLKREIGLLGLIKELDFGPGVTVPEWKSEYNQMLESFDYDALKKIFRKAPNGCKADVGINGINYSVKYTGGARSAIVNHTNRKGFLRVCEQIKLPIGPLDNMIREYWEKRESGLIMEDVANSSLESPFRNRREYLEPIIEYFLFEGTGSRDSFFKADGLLKFGNPTDPTTYKFLSKDAAVDDIWDLLVFSVRNKKGMPVRYDAQLHADLAPWVRYRPGDTLPKGALHIRT